MKTLFARSIVALGLATALGGCVVYEPYPVTHQVPASFDRSWNAAMGALQGEGVAIHQQDRSTGFIAGTRGGVSVSARVISEQGGRVRVEFNTSGGGSQSQELAERLSRAYDHRMGR